MPEEWTEYSPQESKNDQLPSNNDIDKDNIPSEDHIKSIVLQAMWKMRLFSIQKDIEFLLKLLAKNIHRDLGSLI